jgi:hypothetical protein
LKRSGKRYSEKPDGGAGSGAGTPKKELQNFRNSKPQKFLVM